MLKLMMSNGRAPDPVMMACRVNELPGFIRTEVDEAVMLSLGGLIVRVTLTAPGFDAAVAAGAARMSPAAAVAVTASALMYLRNCFTSTPPEIESSAIPE